MFFDAPTPFLEAIEKLADREIAPTALRTADWDALDLEIRERSFFSAGVESARLLQTMRDYLLDYLGGARMENGGLKAQGRAEFVALMRELAQREGLGKVREDGTIDPRIREADLTDIRSISRLQLIFDTQVEAAQEYGYYQQGQDPDILDAFPAQRFIRVRPADSPRPYHADNEGEVRLKSDTAFWLDMNRDFGVPWGPWGFNSGMGVEDVDRIEAEDLGLLRRGQKVRPAARKPLNDKLGASARGLDPDVVGGLLRLLGNAASDGGAGRIAWAG